MYDSLILILFFFLDLLTIKQALTCKEIWSLDNGISLCYGCHKSLEKLKTIMKNMFVCLFDIHMTEEKAK